MSNQLWSYWHAEAEQLEKEVRELKAKLDDEKKLSFKLADAIARSDEERLDERAELIKPKAKLEKCAECESCMRCGIVGIIVGINERIYNEKESLKAEVERMKKHKED